MEACARVIDMDESHETKQSMNAFGDISIGDINHTKLKMDETVEYKRIQKHYGEQALEMRKMNKNVVGVKLHAQFGDLSIEYYI